LHLSELAGFSGVEPAPGGGARRAPPPGARCEYRHP